MIWTLPEYGKAIIRVVKKERYIIVAQCHGCWHCCGSTVSTDDPDEVDAILEKQKSQIMTCQEWKSKPRLKIEDCRKQQLSISSFLGGM